MATIEVKGSLPSQEFDQLQKEQYEKAIALIQILERFHQELPSYCRQVRQSTDIDAMGLLSTKTCEIVNSIRKQVIDIPDSIWEKASQYTGK